MKESNVCSSNNSMVIRIATNLEYIIILKNRFFQKIPFEKYS